MGLKEDLIRDEGLVLKPYRCTAGKLSIGVGRNLDDRGITKEEALYLLENDIKLATDIASRTFVNFEVLSENRKNALINLAFNLGETKLKGFTNTILAIEAGKFESAGEHLKQSKWYRQVGNKRADRIIEAVVKG